MLSTYEKRLGCRFGEQAGQEDMQAVRAADCRRPDRTEAAADILALNSGKPPVVLGVPHTNTYPWR